MANIFQLGLASSCLWFYQVLPECQMFVDGSVRLNIGLYQDQVVRQRLVQLTHGESIWKLVVELGQTQK